MSGQVAWGGTVIIGDFESQRWTTHYTAMSMSLIINAVQYNNQFGEGHGTGELTNYTVNTWSDYHQ